MFMHTIKQRQRFCTFFSLNGNKKTSVLNLLLNQIQKSESKQLQLFHKRVIKGSNAGTSQDKILDFFLTLTIFYISRCLKSNHKTVLGRNARI